MKIMELLAFFFSIVNIHMVETTKNIKIKEKGLLKKQKIKSKMDLN